MKIIEDGRAPNPRRVRIFLAEKGIEMEYEQIDINAGEHRSEAFTALNPMQRIPVLVLDDGTAISETISICRYFEALQPEPSLFGTTPLEKATIDMWLRRAEEKLLGPVAHVLRHTNPRMAVLESPQVPEWGEAKTTAVERSLGRVRPYTSRCIARQYSWFARSPKPLACCKRTFYRPVTGARDAPSRLRLFGRLAQR